MPGVMATSIERQKAAAGNRATDPEVGVRSAAAMGEMAHRNCLPAARPAVRIVHLRLRPLRPGQPIRAAQPASWIAIVPRVRPVTNGRRPAAPFSRVQTSRGLPQAASAVAHEWAAAADGANSGIADQRLLDWCGYSQLDNGKLPSIRKFKKINRMMVTNNSEAFRRIRSLRAIRAPIGVDLCEVYARLRFAKIDLDYRTRTPRSRR
jgi:hypothetical protein